MCISYIYICIILYDMCMHCIALHCTTLHYITLQNITLHYITLHQIPYTSKSVQNIHTGPGPCTLDSTIYRCGDPPRVDHCFGNNKQSRQRLRAARGCLSNTLFGMHPIKKWGVSSSQSIFVLLVVIYIYDLYPQVIRVMTGSYIYIYGLYPPSYMGYEPST